MCVWAGSDVVLEGGGVCVWAGSDVVWRGGGGVMGWHWRVMWARQGAGRLGGDPTRESSLSRGH